METEKGGGIKFRTFHNILLCKRYLLQVYKYWRGEVIDQLHSKNAQHLSKQAQKLNQLHDTLTLFDNFETEIHHATFVGMKKPAKS